MIPQISLAFWTLLLAWLGLQVYQLVYNVLFHPLRHYPGPAAAKATTWWKTYVEVIRTESFAHVLVRLHRQYGMYVKTHLFTAGLTLVLGDVVRVGPNEVSPYQERNPIFPA
jgi:hypothetical protein